MISQKSVQEIIETAKVEEVIQDFVNLKRRGVNMIGLCPFHNEKTPSFTVSPSKNIYKCFGCGRGGNAVQFMMEHESLTFPEALRYLANKFGIEIEETETSQEVREAQQLHDSLYLINQFAREFYVDQLFNSDQGKSVGLSYFKERGFREEVIRKFGLGFAPEKRDMFTLSAVNSGYNIELLRQLGLTTKYDTDFFRGRVMFAIHNLSGKVIGFGGRILAKNVKAPKYINSPETEIYNKSKVLYGAFYAKHAIRQQDECIMVEGYTDVVSLHQAGIENVVASSGTSLTVDQIRLVKRYTPNIKILYDGDYAGVKAALRGLDLVLEQDLNVKVVLLPEGEDPDSYVNKVGVTAFKEYLRKEAKDFIMFKADLLLKEAANDPIRKADLIKDIVSSIAKIPDPIKRAVYLKECAREMEVDERMLINEVNKLVGRQFRKKNQERELANAPNAPVHAEQAPQVLPDPAKPKAAASSGDEFQEKDIVRILISAGGLIFDKEEQITIAAYIIENIEDVLDEFDSNLYQKVVRECQVMLGKGLQANEQYFINHSDKEIRDLAINLLSTPYEYSENWEKKWDIFLRTQKMPDQNFINDSAQSLKRFRLKKIIRMCNKNQKSIEESTKSGDPTKLVTLLKVQQKLIAIRNELATDLGTVILK